MRILFRAFAAMAVMGFVLNLALAQKALKEIPDGEHAKLRKEGSREGHQGPDNPRQGNDSKGQGQWGGPDAYGPEGFTESMDKNERQLNDPQWQLKIDMQDPKRIVVDYPDGSSQEYWYVLFRVINANTRAVKSTTPPTKNPEEVDLNAPPKPLETKESTSQEMEGVPVNCHLDFELQVFTRDVDTEPGDSAWPADPEEEVLTPEAVAERRAHVKKTYRAISDPYVLQRITEQEEMWEWAGNSAGSPEPISLLYPLSDFQRQLGRAHDPAKAAPDLSGPRCLPYRIVNMAGGERTEALRYVAVYGDNTFAGWFGAEDALPDGAHLVNSAEDPMWGKLTGRRYQAGDCVDRFGRVLSPNEPGYLNARVAGGDGGGSYGLLQTGHAAIGKQVTQPHYRQYADGDTVLFNFDTKMAVVGRPNDNYWISGKIVNPNDPRFGSGTKISGSTQQFGATVVGRPVKLLDQRGRALRRSLVTYQAGDTITQAEWDIYRKRIGETVLKRYKGLEDIVGRSLTADDPVVGQPRIKMGYFVGGEERKAPETIKRGVDTKRRGPKGEVILTSEDYVTGRHYDPRAISPEDFMRDPDGEFTTNRVAPVPAGSKLNPGEEYAYAPLGKAGENAVPVPKFDHHGAWQDYVDDLSGVRITLTDDKNELVRDDMDQLLYLKEYEYEYTYLHEYAPETQADEGFKGAHGGDRWKLITEDARMVFKDGKAVAPLMRLVYRKKKVTEPEVVDGYQLKDEKGNISNLTEDEYVKAKGAKPGPNVVKVKILRSIETEQEVVIGVADDGVPTPEGARAETWEEAETRAKAETGVTIQPTPVIRYINRFRSKMVASGAGVMQGDPVKKEDFEESPMQDNGLSGNVQTWRRWTVPPPMVYKDPASGEWQVITRLADKIGPATRWDGADAPRFTTRYVSEMWGAAIFRNVSRDWDWANVMVRGLRGHVAKAGLKLDTTVPDLPNPADMGATKTEKSFFNPRYAGEEWVYRVRYERLGDEFENFRDLIRKKRSFWYRESDAEIGSGG